MTKQELALVVAQVHPAAEAIFEIAAVGAFSRAHPFPVAVGLEAGLPHFKYNRFRVLSVYPKGMIFYMANFDFEMSKCDLRFVFSCYIYY